MTPTQREIAERMLKSKTCLLWPRCGCHETLKRWIYNLNDIDRVWAMEVLECAESLIFISLACVSHHCPDRVVKAYARGQLRDKFWDRQKAMGVHVEP